MAFPTNPINGDQFVANGAKYTYIAAKNAWIKAATQDINAISANTLVTTGNITSSTNITATTGVFPATDNTGTVGNASLTWNGGQFTNLTVDNTLTVTNTLDVRAAIDLADDDILRFGTSDDMEIYHAAAGVNRIDLTVGDLVIRDDADAGDAIRFTFGRTTGDLTVSGNATFSGTGALKVTTGNTSQRPGTPVTGMLRYNSELATFEGYDGNIWGGIGGGAGATGGGSDQVFVETDTTVTTSYTLTTNKNAMTTGPITINDGVTITVPDGSRWIIL